MNWIDRAVGYVSPLAGLRRQAARRAYDRTAAATRTRRSRSSSDRNWGVNTGNPDDARPRRYVSRQAILRLISENPFARKGMNALLNSVIGWGIKGIPAGSQALKKAFAEWITVCDFHGRLDFYGLQELWARHMFRDGEVFIVAYYVNAATGIPLRLRTFDTGMLAINKIGKNIERGIEYDADDRAIAYHFYRTRPGLRNWNGDTIRIPAEEVIHLFYSEFAGQTQGISIFDSVVKRLGDVDEGIEAEVVKANISACMVGFRYRPAAQDGDDPTIGLPVDDAGDRAPVEEFVPGMIETLDPGEEIAFSNPPRSGGIGDLARIALLASSAGIGTTYEQMTGDLSNVNFSSYKAGRLEFNRMVGRIQFLTFIPVALNRVWGWFLKAGIDWGRFPNKPVPITWTPPPIESIDRLGDAEADILEMEAGLESRPNLLAGRGYDEDEIIDQIAKSRDKAAAKKLVFKGDNPNDPVAAPSAVGGRAEIASIVRAVMRQMDRSRDRKG